MDITLLLRKKIIDFTGYWIFKKKYLPVGTDLMEDLKVKINLDINTIFDVGANIGETAKTFHATFKNADIFCFEPISSTWEILLANTKGLKNVHCNKLALGEHVSKVEVKLFDTSQHNLNSLKGMSMNSSVDAKTETVEVDTIDSFLKRNPQIKNIDLLKIDTEGFEVEVIKGATEAINAGKIKLIYAEVGYSRANKRSTHISDLVDFLEKNKFSFFGMYDISIQSIAEQYHYGNALFIHHSVKTNYLVE